MYQANKERYEKMQYKYAGNSGLKLPRISLGLWHNFGGRDNFENMKELLFTAFDNGITYFDLANNYGLPAGSAEENFGKILREDMKAYRNQMVIATKAGYTMWEGPYGDFGSRKYLLSSLDESLSRMGLDYVDIFYHHRMDKNTPLEESMGALDTAVKSGKALYAGISNYDAETTKKAVEILKELKCPFIVNQVRYSMLDRHIEQDDLQKTAFYSGLGLVIFSPLAQGLLTDRYFNGIPDDCRIKTDGRFLKKEKITAENVENLKKLNEIAKSRGQSLSQMALAWLLNKEAVTTVLIGASKKQQILDNVMAIDNMEFCEEELFDIDEICKKIKI